MDRFKVAATGAVLAGLGAGAYLLAARLWHRPPALPAEFVCPITHEVMECPVFTADGHTCRFLDL